MRDEASASNNPVIRALQSGGTAFCMPVRFSRLNQIARMARAAGLDAIYMDMEHSTISAEQVSQLALAAESEGVAPFVRVPSHAGPEIIRVLEGGATGVIVPHVHTPHSLGLWKRSLMEKDFPDDAANFEKKYNFVQRINEETLLYRRTAHVIATTPDQLDMIVKDYGAPEEHVSMIPPGYDDSRFYPVSASSRKAVRQRLGFEGKVVLAIGRLAHNKGYDLLISAFSLVATRMPDAVLHLAVGGATLNPDEQKLFDDLKAQAVTLGLSERVKFSGFVADAELADHYRAADVFVLSSRYEPFGMTAIEAMACGTPTVITTHGGLFRAITFGRHALYADTFDKEDLGISIVKILRHPLLGARLARMGAHKARSLFTWTGIAQQLISLVEERATALAFTDKEWDEPWNDGD